MLSALRHIGPVPALRRIAGRAVWEARTVAAALGAPRDRRIMLYPSMHRTGSSLLRAYNLVPHLARRGWSPLVIPPHLSQRQRQRIEGLFRPEMALVQSTRHMFNRIEHFEGRRYVYDVDDADFHDPACTERERAMGRGAACVIAGSRYVGAFFEPEARRVEVVWTGAPPGLAPVVAHGARRPLIGWAQTAPLAYAAEFDFVEALMTRVAARRGGAMLRLYDWHDAPDHPRLLRLRAVGVSVETMPPLDYQAYVRSLADLAVGLSPLIARSPFSRGKSFGKILGYLDAHTPVICSDAADNALFFETETGAETGAETGIVSNDIDVWVGALCALLDDPARRDRMAAAAHAAFRRRLSTQAAAERVAVVLDDVLAAVT